jgi:hypothetical protein
MRTAKAEVVGSRSSTRKYQTCATAAHVRGIRDGLKWQRTRSGMHQQADQNSTTSLA